MPKNGPEQWRGFPPCPVTRTLDKMMRDRKGFDHGVGHSLLLLYDAKTPRGQKVKEFKGLDHDPSNASISLL
jgi:hypothetical protein